MRRNWGRGLPTPLSITRAMLAEKYPTKVIIPLLSPACGRSADRAILGGFPSLLTADLTNLADLGSGRTQCMKVGSPNTYAPIETASSLGNWTNNKPYANLANMQNGDACIWISPAKFNVLRITESVDAVYNGSDGFVWKYWNGAAWAEFPAGTFIDFPGRWGCGSEILTRPFRGTGNYAWLPPADWASSTINGVTGYAVAIFVVDKTQLATVPTFGTAGRVTPVANSIAPLPVAMSITAVQPVFLGGGADGGSVPSVPLAFHLWNVTQNTFSETLVVAANRAQQNLVLGTPFAVAAGDVVTPVFTNVDTMGNVGCGVNAVATIL